MKEKTGDDGGRKRFNGQNSKTKKNMQRLGGRGLSLEAFANAKSHNPNAYNPAIIKKQKEFYKNAKYVKKYKSLLKQEKQQNEVPTTRRPRPFELRNESGEVADGKRDRKKEKKSEAQVLEEIANKQREEQERARIEREASVLAKQDEKQRSEARRKSLKEKMFKKTKSGQPVMKYRIEHILETLQGSSG
ncbi:OLC1v1007536C1 [Oldenlandia corymbosa var. corymbosa]|uniref:OLC1v1007536C1 n=1 Tax=Oldenlandia corymbosa var. corymbosa TaxID=529605 RepID=A0AAV1DMV2_OLDCO|nr:OLC1v1007536C1 [Oldenlandia corymbosa var. corymbosa]